MKTVFVGIGIPGSGKTTVLKRFAKENNLFYINKDEIRHELLGDATDQSQNKMVWEEERNRIEYVLSEGMSIVTDSTLAEQSKRRNQLEFIQNAGAERIIGIYFDVPLETALERNTSRDRVVPEDAVRMMHRQLQENPPSLEDGFDALVSPENLP